jgi:FHS family L-fucose permease-like MFS transporter
LRKFLALSLVLEFAGLLTLHSYPLYVNIWKRDVMDSHRATKVGIEPAQADDKTLHLERQSIEMEHKSVEAAAEVQEVHK